MAEILAFQKPSINYGPDLTGILGSERANEPVISFPEAHEISADRHISTAELYPLASELNPKLATSLRLLSEGIQLLDEAIQKFSDNDLIASDDSIQRFQALLPELFCCRDLGDGYGASINAVFHSLQNLRGTIANQQQLKAIHHIISRLLTEPFIEFDEAMDEMGALEEAGFTIEPPHFEYAADLLIE